MSPLEPLAPDQRAVVALVLQQGRSYDEIAALLGMPVEAVRARAHAGLAALASDDGLPDEITGPLADYLLGQQPARDAGATRGLLADSTAARAWAADVVAQLADVAPNGLPEIPRGNEPAAAGGAEPTARGNEPAAARGGESAAAGGGIAAAHDAAAAPAARLESPRHDETVSAAAPSPRPRPVREADGGGDSPPAASRLGGVLLIAGVVAVIAVVLFLVLSGGGDPGDEQAASPSPAASATPTPTATPQVADAIPLRSTTGGKAKGTMTVYLRDGRLLFALQAQDVPPSRQGAAYAVWFVGPGDKARRLGFTNPVGKDGQLGIQGPSEKDADAFPELYASYGRVVVSQETTDDAKRPTKVILSGKLPQGR